MSSRRHRESTQAASGVSARCETKIALGEDFCHTCLLGLPQDLHQQFNSIARVRFRLFVINLV